jgi:acyl carrier protein
MADADKIKMEIREYILGEFLHGEDPSSLRDDTQLAGGGVLTSIDTIKLVAWLEDRYGVQFDASEVVGDALKTLTSITDAIQAKQR